MISIELPSTPKPFPTEAAEPKDLEADEAPTYYDENESTYAVNGARYAGGYIGYMDIGSAASVGKGLGVLGNSIEINHVLDALNVVVSTIEHSDVTGNVGGFAVKATWKNKASDASANDILGDANVSDTSTRPPKIPVSPSTFATFPGSRSPT